LPRREAAHNGGIVASTEKSLTKYWIYNIIYLSLANVYLRLELPHSVAGVNERPSGGVDNCSGWGLLLFF
jgi:hypothetical protein